MGRTVCEIIKVSVKVPLVEESVAGVVLEEGEVGRESELTEGNECKGGKNGLHLEHSWIVSLSVSMDEFVQGRRKTQLVYLAMVVVKEQGGFAFDT